MSRPTKIIDERFYIYAARKWAGVNGQAAGTADGKEAASGSLPTGVIVGTAIISACRRMNGHYE